MMMKKKCATAYKKRRLEKYSKWNVEDIKWKWLWRLRHSFLLYSYMFNLWFSFRFRVIVVIVCLLEEVVRVILYECRKRPQNKQRRDKMGEENSFHQSFIKHRKSEHFISVSMAKLQKVKSPRSHCVQTWRLDISSWHAVNEIRVETKIKKKVRKN